MVTVPDGAIIRLADIDGGEVIATVGDQEHRVGPHSLMLFPCATVHGFRVVSPGGARILRLGASDTGVSTGGNTYV
jgi:hypothetical protein